MTGTVLAMSYERTPEIRARNAAANRGRRLSPETIAKREAARRANGNRGRHSHGRRGARTPTYNSWSTMIQRCTNPRATAFAYYGSRGITVCERWRASFDAFLADMGPRPDGTTLDRIDPDRGYEPSNCRWATHAQQAAGRRRSSYYDRPARQNECGHPDRQHKARGMCASCYRRWRTTT